MGSSPASGPTFATWRGRSRPRARRSPARMLGRRANRKKYGPDVCCRKDDDMTSSSMSRMFWVRWSDVCGQLSTNATISRPTRRLYQGHFRGGRSGSTRLAANDAGSAGRYHRPQWQWAAGLHRQLHLWFLLARAARHDRTSAQGHWRTSSIRNSSGIVTRSWVQSSTAEKALPLRRRRTTSARCSLVTKRSLPRLLTP